MTVIPCHTSTNSAVWRKAARWLMLRALLKVMTHFVYLKEYFQGQPLSIAFSQWYTQFASPWTHSSSADYLTLPEEEDFHSAAAWGTSCHFCAAPHAMAGGCIYKVSVPGEGTMSLKETLQPQNIFNAYSRWEHILNDAGKQTLHKQSYRNRQR